MGADLNNIVRTQKLSDDHVQFLVYQILRGLKYIHSAGIIHRVRRECYFTAKIFGYDMTLLDCLSSTSFASLVVKFLYLKKS